MLPLESLRCSPVTPTHANPRKAPSSVLLQRSMYIPTKRPTALCPFQQCVSYWEPGSSIPIPSLSITLPAIYQDVKRFVDMANQGHLVTHSKMNLTEKWRWYHLSSLNSISWCPPKAFQVYAVSQKDPHFRSWTCSGHYLMYKKIEYTLKRHTQRENI